ncbi:hypothetical protein [Lysobacter capsici]|uniref:hypothetical protein n=1 Tax=Lysobacter capsici TaxID=435897 RepID=UPI00287B9C02|nr:hypothetical protein [Lysobacter capsici]WND83110.1 hypothetical protein RJ610_12475 [Lysobacter capsici]WND88309.1 hypothetical protein RJ609_12485 [Lysobacter capsici]
MEGLNRYDVAIIAAGLVAVVGIIVLALELRAALRWSAGQSGREIRYLTDWWMYDDGESLVGAAHANRSTARHAHASEPTSAAGQGECDGPPPRPDDAFEGFTGTIDEFLDAELQREVDAHNDAMFERCYGEFSHLYDADGYLDLGNAAPCDQARFYGHDDLSVRA